MPKLLPLLTLLLCASASAELRAEVVHGSYGHGSMKVYDGEKLLFQAESQGLNGVTESKFSPDGRWLVNIADRNGYMQLWDVTKGERVRTFLSSAPRVLNADFTPDSRRLLLNFWGDKLTTEQHQHWEQYASSLWTLKPLQRLGKLSGNRWYDSRYTGNVHFDAASQRMVTASYRQYEGQAAAVWNAKTGALITVIPRLPYPAEAQAKGAGGRGSYDARLSPDGKRALVAYVGYWLAEYDAGTGKLLKVRGKFDDAGAKVQLDKFAEDGK